ncbi:MAG: prepilin-type N-terminal cleavage/methylation domain-containing protein [Acidobacteriia bacterium]|nr:prepilin-type N-terminal cleavage/methylation domain-containing protein [Terriglobia bacterium]
MLLAHCESQSGKAGIRLLTVTGLAVHRKTNSYNNRPGMACSRSKQRTRGKGSDEIRGFSLVELLIAMAVLMVISAIAIPHLVSAVDSARNAKAVGDIKSIETDILGYESTNGMLPDSLAQIGDDKILDPWKNPYQYLNHTDSQGNGQLRQDRFLVPLNSDYDLYSLGKDGQTAQPITAATSQDDVIRVGSSGYIGLASQF